MKRLSLVLTALIFSSPAAAAPPGLLQLQDAFADLAARSKPAVVNISTVHEEQVQVQAPHFFFGEPEDMFQDFFGGRPQGRTYRYRSQGTGTGFIIDPKGYLLTNNHVIQGATEIKVTRTLSNGKDVSYAGKVVGRDPNLDVAVVKIKSDEEFPSLELADSSKVRVGDWAVAIGSPFALEQTVTAGIISAVRQSLYIEGRRYPNMLQTDAAINRGNSGGPLLNIEGKVVGINTAIYSPNGSFAGIGFAIPANEVKAALDALLAGKKLRRGWVGIEAGPVDEVVKRRFGLPSADGALVNSVFPGSPAEKAGVKRGDVIREFNGVQISGPQDLVGEASRLEPGKKIPTRFYRQGTPMETSIALAERPEWADAPGARPRGRRAPPREDAGEEQPVGSAFDWQGVRFSAGEEGVFVESLGADSPLAGFLMPGDVVCGINDAAVPSLEALRAATRHVKISDGIFLDIVRDGQPLFLSVKPS